MSRLSGGGRTWCASVWNSTISRLATGTCAAVLCGSLSGGVLSDARAATKAAAAPVEYLQLRSGGPALAELAAVVSKLDVGEPSFVAVAPVVFGEGGGHREEAWEGFRKRLGETVASVVPLAKIRAPNALNAAAARRAAREARLPLVYLEPHLAAGQLSVRITVKKWPQGFWRKALQPEGVTTHSLGYQIAADSSIRRHFAVPSALATKTTRMKSPLRSPLAAACGNIGDEDVPDVALVSRSAIVVGGLTESGFKEHARRRWSDLSPIASAPLRAPLAGASFTEGTLMVGLSDREWTVQLDRELKGARHAPRTLPTPSGCQEFSATGVVPRSRPCPSSSEKPPTPTPPEEVRSSASRDLWQELSLATPSGGTLRVRAELLHGDPTAQIHINSPLEEETMLKLDDTGDALLLVDLDGNGTLEVVSSTSTRSTKKDSLRIHSYQSGRLEKVAEIDMGPITALATCPFSGTNPLRLIATTEDEIWVIE